MRSLRSRENYKWAVNIFLRLGAARQDTRLHQSKALRPLQQDVFKRFVSSDGRPFVGRSQERRCDALFLEDVFLR